MEDLYVIWYSIGFAVFIVAFLIQQSVIVKQQRKIQLVEGYAKETLKYNFDLQTQVNDLKEKNRQKGDAMLKLGIEMCKAKERADIAEVTAIGFQSNLAAHLKSCDADDLVRCSLIPDVDRVEYYEVDGTGMKMHTAKVRTITASIGLALRHSTPPELVAGDIAERVRKAVLREWQSQSLLNGGGI